MLETITFTIVSLYLLALATYFARSAMTSVLSFSLGAKKADEIQERMSLKKRVTAGYTLQYVPEHRLYFCYCALLFWADAIAAVLFVVSFITALIWLRFVTFALCDFVYTYAIISAVLLFISASPVFISKLIWNTEQAMIEELQYERTKSSNEICQARKQWETMQINETIGLEAKQEHLLNMGIAMETFIDGVIFDASDGTITNHEMNENLDFVYDQLKKLEIDLKKYDSYWQVKSFAEHLWIFPNSYMENYENSTRDFFQQDAKSKRQHLKSMRNAITDMAFELSPCVKKREQISYFSEISMDNLEHTLSEINTCIKECIAFANSSGILVKIPVWVYDDVNLAECFLRIHKKKS